MNRWARCVLLGIVIGVVMVLPAQLISLAQQPAKEPVRPAPEVIAAWEKAGAEFGWIYMNQSGYLEWRGKKDRVAGAVPAFRVTVFPTGKSNALPAPRVPFGVYLKGPQVTDAGLKQLAGQKQLQTLTFNETQVSDMGLKELVGLTHLQTLNLSNSRLTDVGLKELAGLKELQKLGLSGTKVTDAGLKQLAGLTQLRTLNLRETKVTDAGLKQLAGLTHLQTLNLSETKVTDTGLKELAGLEQLQTLNLGLTKVSDTGLKELAGLTQLHSLTLLLTKVTDAGLKELAGLKQLQTLDLRGTKVTDAWKKELGELKHLRTVSFGEKKFTRAASPETGRNAADSAAVPPSPAEANKQAESEAPNKQVKSKPKRTERELWDWVLDKGKVEATSKLIEGTEGVPNLWVALKIPISTGDIAARFGEPEKKTVGEGFMHPKHRKPAGFIPELGEILYYGSVQLLVKDGQVLEVRSDFELPKERSQSGTSAADSAAAPPALQTEHKERSEFKPVENKSEKAQNWPRMTGDLTGRMEVRVKNPNDSQVRVGLRSDGKGKDFTVGANGTQSVSVPNGRYDIYFQYSTDPDSLYQGDSFTLKNNGVEIQIVKVVNGNYGIKKVK